MQISFQEQVWYKVGLRYTCYWLKPELPDVKPIILRHSSILKGVEPHTLIHTYSWILRSDTSTNLSGYCSWGSARPNIKILYMLQIYNETFYLVAERAMNVASIHFQNILNNRWTFYHYVELNLPFNFFITILLKRKVVNLSQE